MPQALSRRLLAQLVAASAALLAIAASHANDAVKGEGFLDIVARPYYLERGTTDARFDWITGFEKSTGCKVRVTVANNADEMVAMMSNGAVDAVIASSDASDRLIHAGRVREVNTNTIAAWNTVDARLRDAPWNAVAGKRYGVPFQWNVNWLAYSTKVFKTPPRSWKVVFEQTQLPDGRTNVGRIQAFNGAIYIADAALYLKSAQPNLGIKDPYELNSEQYRVVLDMLRQQRRMIIRYWQDPLAQIDDFESESVVASMAAPYQINALRLKDADVASVIPEEGATGWVDSSMVHVYAPHPVCAQAWLNYSLTPKVQGDVAAWLGSVPAVPNACSANALLGEQGCERNGVSQFTRVHFWRAPTAKCAQGDCVPHYRWTTDFMATLGGR
jgi:putative spermidine/putrescine transport system substrate-binding protein